MWPEQFRWAASPCSAPSTPSQSLTLGWVDRRHRKELARIAKEEYEAEMAAAAEAEAEEAAKKAKAKADAKKARKEAKAAAGEEEEEECA